MFLFIRVFAYQQKLMISPHDIFLGFLAGCFQVGLGFIFITTGASTTPSAMVGIIMLSESVLGPLWAFLFVSERPSMYWIDWWWNNSFCSVTTVLFTLLIKT